jgi:hypothetical protein
MLVALLFYGYATGVFSSRKLAQATYDSIAFRYICANTHPDHRTIADFRKRFLGELAALFTEVLLIAQAMGLVKLGTVSLDGDVAAQPRARDPGRALLGVLRAGRVAGPALPSLPLARDTANPRRGDAHGGQAGRLPRAHVRRSLRGGCTVAWPRATGRHYGYLLDLSSADPGR